MLTAKNLERIMELEEKLKSQYEEQLNAKNSEIAKIGLERDKLQTVVDTQLKTISELSEKTAVNERAEQLNRELTNRANKLQDEVSTLKSRAKGLQKELAQEREELKTLRQFDPPRMKKNLASNKKKLAEASTANNLLQQNLNKTKTENMTLQQQVKELEAKLEALEASESDDSVEGAVAGDAADSATDGSNDKALDRSEAQAA
jgi:chromosome segregation ATPase